MKRSQCSLPVTRVMNLGVRHLLGRPRALTQGGFERGYILEEYVPNIFWQPPSTSCRYHRLQGWKKVRYR